LIESNPVGIEYLVRNRRMQEDHTNKIPDKTITMERLPWGFFGYTYLGMGKAWLNDKLPEDPEFKKKVDYHEVAHTNDELETRYLMHWAFDIDENKIRKDVIKAENYNVVQFPGKDIYQYEKAA
jgi:hypothetical protein